MNLYTLSRRATSTTHPSLLCPAFAILPFSEAADYSKDSVLKPVFRLRVWEVEISPAAYGGRNVLHKRLTSLDPSVRWDDNSFTAPLSTAQESPDFPVSKYPA